MIVSAVLSCVFAVPLAALFTDASVELTSKLIVGGLALVALWRPAHAVLVLTGLLPLALGLQVLIGGLPHAAEWTEALVFAFLAGAAWRVAWPQTQRRDRLARPALVLAVIVVASAIVDLAVQQAAVPSRSVWTELWRHLLTQFPFQEPPFTPFHETMRWLGGLTLAVFLERILRQYPDVGIRMTRIWLVGGAAAASFAVLRISQILLEGKLGSPLTTLRFLADNVRVSVLHPDQNAAGSFFVLLLVPALIIGVVRRRWWLIAIVCPIVAVAFFAAQSRSAVGAMFIVLGAVWMIRVSRNRRLIAAVVVFLMVMGGSIAAWMATSESHASPVTAMWIRAELNRVSLRIVREHPVFGIGLTHYRAASRRVITPDLVALKTWAPEGQNAHNNFLQILAEVGIAGLAAFLWLVGPLALPWRRAGGRGAAWSVEARAIGAGLAAFLVSACMGHPLLITQVLVAFFVALGLAAGLSPAPEGRGSVVRLVTWVSVALLLVTLPWRVSRAFAVEPPTEGVGHVAGELDGVVFQPVESRAWWRVPGGIRQVSLPVRWADAAAADCEVQVLFDGRVADRVTPTTNEWLPVRFSVPAAPAGDTSRRLELRVSDGRCQLLAGPIELQ